MNTRYRELCAEQGSPIQDIGISSTREAVDYFESLGCEVEWIRDKWQWTLPVSLDKAFEYMKSLAYSFTTFAPDDIHSTAIEKLESELQQQFGSLTTEYETPNQIYLVIILLPG